MVKPGSYEVSKAEKEGEGGVRRSVYAPNGELLVSPDPANVKIVNDIIHSAAERYGDDRAVGYRDTIKIHHDTHTVEKIVDGKTVKQDKQWTYYELSDYKYLTYKELAQAMAAAGAALVATGHSADTIFNIYAQTSHRWQIMAHGCASQSITFATAYDSLGLQGLKHSINEPKVYGMFTNASLLQTVAEAVPETPSLKVLVYDGRAEDIDAAALETIEAHGIKTYHYDDFLALGRANPVERNLPAPDDIACIMYTSGSTGAPKGVRISNANIIGSVASIVTILPMAVRHGESYIAYLPLAHILEFVVECAMIYAGCVMGYGTVKTLTDTSCKNCVGDLRAFRPTTMVGVPAVWETIRKGILTKVKQNSALKQRLFHLALSIKKATGPSGVVPAVLDRVVFAPLKEATGGRLRYALSGGAALSIETQEFLSLALVPILAGYGMTEGTAMCALLPPDYFAYGRAGVPMPSAEIKLVDVPDAGYRSTNKPPQGEVWVRGPSVTRGYFNQPELTAEAYTSDGWLKTGDVGQWNDDGSLSIIDRKKNLVKLSGGEYIAIEKLESVYKASQFVSNICIHADSNASKPMAIIFPHAVNIAHSDVGKKHNGDFEAAVNDPDVKKAIQADLAAVGKKAGLKPLETLQTIILTDTEWTPESGLVTAAQKLNRKKILDVFKDDIKKVYS